MDSENPMYGSKLYSDFPKYEQHILNEVNFDHSVECCYQPNNVRNRPEIIFSEDWQTGEYKFPQEIAISPNCDFFVGKGNTAKNQVRESLLSLL